MKRRKFIKVGGVAASTTFVSLYSCSSVSKPAIETDILIIGAGLSGINAALTLEQFGYKTTIVEATDRVGGRVFTAKDTDVPGHPELGANGLGGGYARLIDAADRYGVEIGPMRPRTEPREGELLFGIDNKLMTAEQWAIDSSNPFNQDWAKKLSPGSVHWQMYSKLNPLPKNNLTSWRSEEFKDWDKSVFEFLKENGFTDEAIKLGVSTNSSYGTSAKDTSVLMYFQILNFINQQSSLNTGRGGAAVGGNQRIPEAMANAINGNIRLNSPVSSISSIDNQVTTTLEDNTTIKSKFVIVTVPAYALRQIDIYPKMPELQLAGINELGYTPCTQFHFVPKKNYWEEDGLGPSIWTDTYAGRFMALKNDLDDPDKVTSCVAYTNSTISLELSQMDQQKATSLVLQSLENLRPSLKGALEPVYYWTWSNNPYAGGAYAYWKPGQITKYANEFAKPHGRIHFAGEHTAVLMRGMEGAMESGERVALEVMNLLG